MNDLQEKAEIYAEEKMKELISKAIAQAYLDGYQNGYNDRHRKIEESNYINTEIDFGDIGLPSGTLWSLNFLKNDTEEPNYLPYAKAVKLGLPSKEQVDELIEKCRWLGDYSSSGLTFYGATCIGSTGEKISFISRGYMKDDKKVDAPNYGGGCAYFWIQDDENEDEKNAVRIRGVQNGKPIMEFIKIFSGYKLPVLIVRK